MTITPRSTTCACTTPAPFALHHPELLRGLVILDPLHPALFDHALHQDPDQQRASAYMLHARRPDAAQLFAADDFASLRAALDALVHAEGLGPASAWPGQPHQT